MIPVAGALVFTDLVQLVSCIDRALTSILRLESASLRTRINPYNTVDKNLIETEMLAFSSSSSRK